MSSEHYVYGLFQRCVNNQLDKCFYIGKGCGNRLNEHFKEFYLNEENSSNLHKTRKIKKLKSQGKKVYSRKIFNCLDEERAYKLERLLISFLGLENLTNIFPGGEGGPSGSKNPAKRLEVKKKISESWTDKRKKEQPKGENHPFYGCSHSEETKRKISNSRKGKCSGEDHFLYDCDSEETPMYGKKHSKDVKNEISKSMLGERNHMFGKSRPEKVKQKISKATRGEKSNNSKLKKKDVCEIRWLLKNTKMTQREISEKYGVARYTISDIKRCNTWNHVNELKKPSSLSDEHS